MALISKIRIQKQVYLKQYKFFITINE